MPTIQTFPRSPETIVLSDEERSQVEACLAALSRDGESHSVVSPQLTTSDEIVDLSPELAELLRRLLAALAQGQGVSLVPDPRSLRCSREETSPSPSLADIDESDSMTS